jgi:hydroxymethylbilane synthase
VSAPPLPAAVTLGTRGSALARAQTELVAALLAAARPEAALSTQVLSTAGDRTQESGEPLPEIGGKGLFTAELERALLEGEIDVAVHSLKDLPTQDATGVVVGAVTSREDVRDCLVTRSATSLSDLGEGAVVGTSSLRRAAQLTALRPDLEIRSIRGNVDTRIRKVEAGEYDAALLAAAGIRRLGLEHAVSEWLAPETVLPAPGQGALAIQCRADDVAIRNLLADMDDPAARAETTAERAFLEALGGGCAAPVAALAVTTTTPRVRLQGLVASVDGRDVVRVRGEGDPAEVGARLAQEALSLGADRILRNVR